MRHILHQWLGFLGYFVDPGFENLIVDPKYVD
jgi:hypothetical protein